MCQIMYIKSSKLNELLIKEVNKIEEIMFNKGEYYNISGISIKNNIVNNFTFSHRNDFFTYFKKNRVDEVVLFSRQAPEMEVVEQDIEKQPYYNKKLNKLFFIHGTIYNDKILAEKYNKSINIDTEIMKYIENESEIDGLYSLISYDYKKGQINYKNMGLGLWEYCNRSIFNVDSDKLIITQNIENRGRLLIDKNANSSILFAAYSGGMDISLSICKLLETNSYNKVYLNYFDFGTNSKNIEIKALYKFKELVSTKYNVEVDAIVREDSYFKQYFKLINSKPKLTDNSAKADENEAEEAITYVPYRNSQFVLLMGALCESMNLYNVDIVLGLNLSEGMVYGDNAEPWLESVDRMVKLGGKDPKQTLTFNVIAPYFMKTKTNMLKDFLQKYGRKYLEQILKISTSCYYPINGKPCNKCGSCKLRNEAIKRATE